MVKVVHVGLLSLASCSEKGGELNLFIICLSICLGLQVRRTFRYPSLLEMWLPLLRWGTPGATCKHTLVPFHKTRNYFCNI